MFGRCVQVAALVWIALLALPAQAASYAENRAEVVQTAVDRLVALGEWCHERKGYATRNAIAEDILYFDDTQAQAHKWLKHRFVSGTWKPPKKAVPSKDWDSEKLAGLSEQRRQMLQPAVDALIELSERHADELSPADSDRLIRDLVRLVPDDEGFREMAGEVREGDDWILAETARTAARRSFIKVMAESALEQFAPPAQATLKDFEQSSGVEWTTKLKSQSVRVITTVDESESRRAARLVEAAATFFRDVFGTDKGLPDDLTLYLFDQSEPAYRFFDAHPSIGPAKRKRMEGVKGTFIDHLAIAQWAETRPRRLDGTVRQAIAYQSVVTFGPAEGTNGFVMEGLGLRLAWQITGTRLTFFVTPSKYAHEEGSALVDHLQEHDANWLLRASDLLKEGKSADIRRLLTVKVNDMTAEDTMFSFCLASYLLEGQAKKMREFLYALGSGKSPEAIAEEIFETDLPTLQYRFERWVHEARNK